MNEELQQTVMSLILYAGDARSDAIEAIRAARKNNFEEAKKLLESANEKMNEAHSFQAKLLFAEANGEEVPTSILIIHAQDHVMNALTVKDLATEMVEILEERQ